MATKKKQQKQKTSSSPTSKGKTATSAGPKLQISAENENRLRRLLLNSGRSTQLTAPENDSLTKEQKAKKLRSVYEQLSCEGFSDDQIERSLSAVKDTATFKSALDWLCLNLPGNELPLKFSSGTSQKDGGSVGVISTARENWVPSVDDSEAESRKTIPEVSVRVKGWRDDESLDSFQHAQANWIRQYIEQQEEDESESWESDLIENSSTEQVLKPRSDYGDIVKEYRAARLESINAKERGNKAGQQKAGQMIRKLKQEISALGLSADILASGYGSSSSFLKETSDDSMPENNIAEANILSSGDCGKTSAELGSEVEQKCVDSITSHELLNECNLSSAPSTDINSVEGGPGDVELGNFFFEDAANDETLPPAVLELQKKERRKDLLSEKNLEKLEGIWKKGDPKKIPKAFLQQLCQREGWDAPKYSKGLDKRNSSSYTVSVLRKASGRGKSRKAGGLMSIQLPSHDEISTGAEAWY